MSSGPAWRDGSHYTNSTSNACTSRGRSHQRRPLGRWWLKWQVRWTTASRAQRCARHEPRMVTVYTRGVTISSVGGHAPAFRVHQAQRGIGVFGAGRTTASYAAGANEPGFYAHLGCSRRRQGEEGQDVTANRRWAHLDSNQGPLPYQAGRVACPSGPKETQIVNGSHKNCGHLQQESGAGFPTSPNEAHRGPSIWEQRMIAGAGASRAFRRRPPRRSTRDCERHWRADAGTHSSVCFDRRSGRNTHGP